MTDIKVAMMAQFYEECQKKGYTDMHDDVQSLKAKVIATDLGLKYKNIVNFYEEARTYYDLVQKELAESRRQAEIRRQKDAEEAARRAVNGELLLTLSDSRSVNAANNVIRVYIRPDGSFYHTINNGIKVEGSVTVYAEKASKLTFTYNPAQAIYTGVTVGGVTTGGVDYIDESYSSKLSKSGKGDILARAGDLKITLQLIEISDYTKDLFKRDSHFKSIVGNGKIQCYQNTSTSDMFMNSSMMMNQSLEYRMNAASLAVDEMRLPYDRCVEIARFVGGILRGDFPLSDEKTYAKAMSLSEKPYSETLARALTLFNSISDYKDAAQQAKIVEQKYIETTYAEALALSSSENLDDLKKAKSKFDDIKEYNDAEDQAKRVGQKYDELLQLQKERAVLEMEANQEKKKKLLKKLAIIIPLLAIAVAGLTLFYTKSIVPMQEYKKAENLFESGNYEEAAAIYDKLGNYNDAASRAEIASQKEAFEELEALYLEAKTAFDHKDYLEASELFTELGDFKDSLSFLNESNYQLAVSLLSFGAQANYYDVEQAYNIFSDLGNYKDSAKYLSQMYLRPISNAIVRTKGTKSKEDDTRFYNDMIYNEYGIEIEYAVTGKEIPRKYNEFGQMISDSSYSYEYNNDGLLIRKYSDKTEYLYDYDPYGNIISEKEYSKQNSTYEVITYEHRYENNLLVETTKKDGSFTTVYKYAYDNMGRLINESHTINNKASAKTEYKYDNRGLLVEKKYDAYDKEDDRTTTYNYSYIWAPKAVATSK